MIFAQHRLKRDILTAKNRFQMQRLALLGDTGKHFSHMRRRAATPRKLCIAFVAGFIFVRLQPAGWNTLSAATGAVLSLFEHKYFVSRLTRLFDTTRYPVEKSGGDITGEAS